MSAMPPVELTVSRAPLGAAFHDLLTDGRVTDGLVIDAWPVDGGRVTRAFQTASGAYAFTGLDRMRRWEHPVPGLPAAPPRDFLVQVVDRRGRFVPTVLRVSVPSDGLLTQGDVLDLDDGPDGVADLPIFLFSAPQRPLPTHVAAVRAQVVDADSGEPAAWCRMEVVVEPDGAGHRRTGIADATGAVVVALPYPRFPLALDDIDGLEEGDQPDPGTRGSPVTDANWPVEVTVRWQPDSLDRHRDAIAPALDRIVAQGPVLLQGAVDEPFEASLSRHLSHGVDLILRTDGDPGSRLLIERPSE